MERVRSFFRALPCHIRMMLKVVFIAAAIDLSIVVALSGFNLARFDAFTQGLISAALLFSIALPVVYYTVIKPYNRQRAATHRAQVEKLEAMQQKLERSNRELISLSQTDTGTGLANKRAFEFFYNLEYRGALRTKTPISVLMIDVDSFKPFNDNYGHQEGDRVLKEVATVLTKVFVRATDFIGRFGGEEFVAVLPNTDSNGAQLVAEKVLKAVRGLGIPHEFSAAAAAVTVSVGVATMTPGLEVDEDSLLGLADDALYSAKEGGRDRFTAVSTESLLKAHITKAV